MAACKPSKRLLIPSIRCSPFSAVSGKNSHPVGQLAVARDDTTRIAIGAEILAGIKRKGCSIAEGADQLAFVAGEVGLGQPSITQRSMLPAIAHDGVHVASLSIKVHRNDADRS